MTTYVLGMLGVAVFAISGGLAAGGKGMDWVGVVALATVTALGGGTIRDILLNRDMVFWIEDPAYLYVIISSSALTIAYVRFFKPPLSALLIADAFGLALFAVVGAQIAEQHDVSSLIVVVMGVLTAVAGGVIRDVLTGEIPLLFRASETIYSVTVVAGILVYLVAQGVGVGKQEASIIGIVTIAMFRLAAIFWKIRLPLFHMK